MYPQGYAVNTKYAAEVLKTTVVSKYGMYEQFRELWNEHITTGIACSLEIAKEQEMKIELFN
jgi:hypothetical protein